MNAVLSAFDALRLRLWLRSLERPMSPRDRVPFYLFWLALLAYWWIGELINEFGGFRAFNYFFNADCPRVLSDMVRSHREATSGAAASVAHPLFVLISNLPTAVLNRALGRSEQTAALLVCHVVASLGVVLFYLVLRRLSLPRWLAAAGSVCYAASTSHLVGGSIIETYPFAGAAIMLGIWTALRSTSCVRNACVQILAYGTHLVLSAHSVLAAPALWVTQMPFRRFAVRVLAFWTLLAIVGIGLFSLQRELYPDTDVTSKAHYNGFMPWHHPPSNSKQAKETAIRLIPHLVLFNVVAPRPRFTGEPERITTFMWQREQDVPRYTVVGWGAALTWILAALVATWCNVRHFLKMSKERRGVILLCFGWMVGVTGVFMTYGDDYLLYSALWSGHLILWVWLGLATWLVQSRRYWLSRVAVGCFLAMLVTNNADFVQRMLRHYHTARLMTW